MSDGIAAQAALRPRIGRVLPVQVAWALLAALWNLWGVWLVAHGGRSPGPTASMLAGLLLLGIAVGFVLSVTRRPTVYLLLSIISGLFALAAVVNAVTADPLLWPSDFWRYAGAALNGAGFLACLWGILAFSRWKRSGPQQRPPRRH